MECQLDIWGGRELWLHEDIETRDKKANPPNMQVICIIISGLNKEESTGVVHHVQDEAELGLLASDVSQIPGLLLILIC